MNRIEEVWQSIDENINKLTKVLADIDPEIHYNRTLNVLYISERVLVTRTTNLIYAKVMNPDLADVFLARLCYNPKPIEDRFNLIKTLMKLGYNTYISNASGPNVINAQAVNHITHKLFYFSQYNYVTVTERPNMNFDLEIHIANELNGISDYKETRKINKTSFDIKTCIITPSDDETIAVDESYECKLTNIPVSEIYNEIVKIKETVAKHSKLIAIDKILRNEVK